MALAMKSACERCESPLALDSAATICSYERTFCASCAGTLAGRCPNCDGELVPRPKRR